MSQATFETEVSPEGTVTVQVPASVAKANQRVTVTVQSKLTTPEERAAWLKAVSAFHGSIDDPTFIRHPEGELRELGTLD